MDTELVLGKVSGITNDFKELPFFQHTPWLWLGEWESATPEAKNKGKNRKSSLNSFSPNFSLWRGFEHLYLLEMSYIWMP